MQEIGRRSRPEPRRWEILGDLAVVVALALVFVPSCEPGRSAIAGVTATLLGWLTG